MFAGSGLMVAGGQALAFLLSFAGFMAAGGAPLGRRRVDVWGKWGLGSDLPA